jgi:glycosyltransferase involved in cell wall biosynthesis
MTITLRTSSRPEVSLTPCVADILPPPNVDVYDRLAELALRDEIETLRAALIRKDEQLAQVSQQELVLRRQVASLTQGWSRRLLAPFRSLQTWLKPPRMTLVDLLPVWQIDEDPRGQWHGWISAGRQPKFLMARWLPQGQYRMQLQFECDRPGQLELTAQLGPDRESARRVVSLPVAAGCHSYDVTITIPGDAIAAWLQPIDTPARFRFHDFSFERTTGPRQPDRLPIEPPRPRQVLNIAYVLKSAGLCGGVRSALEQASRLGRRGHNVTVFFINDNADWFDRSVNCIRMPDAATLIRELAKFRGIKIATWYETAPWVAESLRPGDRGYYLVQDVEESYVTGPNGASEVHDTYRLGLRPLTISRWIERQLRDRFGLDPVLHSIGLDHDVFQPQLIARLPHLLLTQCRTWSGGGEAGEWLKGWDTAAQVIGRLHESDLSMELATFSMEQRPVAPRSLRHRHYHEPSDATLARLYSQAGVYLLTSRHEGFGLTAAEAMACGCPVVATRADGNEEFCVDGQTALLADRDDVHTLAEHCRRVMSDPELAAELSRNGRAAISAYTWDRVIDRLEQAFLDETIAPLSTPGAGCQNLQSVARRADGGLDHRHSHRERSCAGDRVHRLGSSAFACSHQCGLCGRGRWQPGSLGGRGPDSRRP